MLIPTSHFVLMLALHTIIQTLPTCHVYFAIPAVVTALITLSMTVLLVLQVSISITETAYQLAQQITTT